jgi:hypothetical protein
MTDDYGTPQRVVELPIVETAARPRVLLFEHADRAEAEAFYFEYIEREDVDDFYVIIGTPEETSGRWGIRRA